jgi:hypothetical protein
MLFEENDFEDNVSIMAAGRFRPHFTLKDGELELRDKPTFMQSVISYLREYSYIMYFLCSNSKLRVFSSFETTDENYKVELMCKILKEMQSYAKENNIKFVVYYMMKDEKRRYPRIKECCDANALRLVPVILRPEERFYGFGHMNLQGHLDVAELIYQDIVNNGLVQACRAEEIK